MTNDKYEVADNLFTHLQHIPSVYPVLNGIRLSSLTQKDDELIVLLRQALPEAIMCIPESFEGYRITYEIIDPIMH